MSAHPTERTPAQPTAARSGLCGVVGHADRGEAAWDTPVTAEGMSAAEIYRCWLFEDGRERSGARSGGAKKRAGIGGENKIRTDAELNLKRSADPLVEAD
jgi:hypothetical protein